jgi:hypothetical protein
MKSRLLIPALVGASMLLASTAYARQVVITTEMTKFKGPRAYVVVYLTDPSGAVYDTLSIGGRQSKYYGHLRGWYRGAKNSRTPISAVTGASVGSGQTLQTTVEIADTLLNAGFQIRVDASVEDYGDHPKAAILTLGSQTTSQGRGIVRSVSVD